jgi:serine/threonine protein kinase
MGIEGLLVGRVLGDRYRIEEVIGRGGMGAVYRATDERLGRQVALKVITVAGTTDAESRERLRARFFREARSAAALPHHPNVVPVYDYGSDEALGLDYLVMELLRGSDLASRLATSGIPPLSLSLRILVEAARGLAVGHRQGLIHRDVKPGNIFLARDANDEIQVRVVDFGIAKLADEDTAAQLTQDGRAPHSPAYASPEQLRGLGQLTPASDVFGLGAVAFQLVTGERPFDESDRNRMSLGMPVEPPAIRQLNPALPGTVEAVILRALEFDPLKRYPDAAAMARDLEQAIRSLTDAPIEPYAAVGVPPQIVLEDLDDRTLPAEEDVEERTLPAEPEEDDRTLLAPEPVPASMVAPPTASERPTRQPLPPRRPPETRRGIGGVIVWGLVLVVLLAAGLWGWNEMQRAPGIALDLPEPDTTVAQPPEDTIPAEVIEAYGLNANGRTAYNEQRYDDALYYFRRAVDLSPDNYDFRRNYGLTLFQMGRFADAEREFREAMDIDSDEALVYYNVGQTRLAQGDTLEAIALYREYIQRESNPAQRQRAARYLQEWEAAMNPAIDLIGEPIDRPQPGEPLPAGDTVAAPMPPGEP